MVNVCLFKTERDVNFPAAVELHPFEVALERNGSTFEIVNQTEPRDTTEKMRRYTVHLRCTCPQRLC